MTTVFNDNREMRLPLSYRIFTLVAVFLLSLTVASMFFALAHSNTKTASSSFTFTATGDYGQTSNTASVLQKIGGAGQSFNLALGDLNYDYPTVTAQQWASNALTELGSTTFPFEFVAGDHDYNSGDLAALENDLPAMGITLGSQSKAYGEEYYFDYPATNPLARFIMVSPVILPQYNYSGGGNPGNDYTWVKNQIEAAKSQGLWVIVGMAEGCIFISSPSDKGSCQDGALFNLLVSEKVDLVLQAHLHYYAGGDQLALNGTTCTSIPTNGTFNKNCVADSSGNYTQGNGTVFVNDGTGGKSLISINYSTDPKAGYFRTGAWDGSNVNKTYGYSRYTISASGISMQFVPVVGTYKDSFTINKSNPTSTPTSTATSTPSVTPSATPGTTIAQDDFQRANHPEWGLASDGNNTWGADANTHANFAIVNDTGQVTGSASSATSYNATLGPGETNAEVVASGSLSSFGTNTWGGVLRWTDGNDFYKASINGSNLVISKKVSGKVTTLKSVSFKATAGTSYTIDFSVVGSTLSASAWQTNGGTAPGSPMVSATDTSLSSSGSCGVLAYLANGVSADFTAFQAISH